LSQLSRLGFTAYFAVIATTASQVSGNSLISFTADAPPEAYLGIDNNLCCRTLRRLLGSWRHRCLPDT
jgi:hypothetical protein